MNQRRSLIVLLLIVTCYSSFAQITIGTNFEVRAGLPIDSRMVVANLTARDAINPLLRYEGLSVYVVGTQTNYQLIGGITNPNWQAIGSGSSYTAGTGLVLTGNSFFHGNHEGDVSGSTTLTVIALQGRSISTSIPTSDNILGWNGSAWAPTTDNNTTYTSGTGITLTGTTFTADNNLAIWNANKLNGTSISTITPSSNEILKWNGSEWIPDADNNTTYDAGTGITLSSGTFSAQYYSAMWNANQLQGLNISTNAPSNNQILKWNGSEWIPAVERLYYANTGLSISGSTFSANYNSSLWNANKLQGNPISVTPPTSNQVLKWDGFSWTPGPDNNTSYSGGTGISLSGVVISADNTSSIWNASQLQGIDIDATTPPSTNQVLKYNGSSWAPATDNSHAYVSGTGLSLVGYTFFNSGDLSSINEIQNLSYTAASRALNISSATGTTLPLFSTTSTDAGLLPGSNNGGASVFMNGNGTWSTPTGTLYSAGTGITLSSGTFSLSGPVSVSLGGTGQTSYSDGQLLIGNTAGGLTKSTITSGSGISITNGNGTITITNTDLNATHTGDATGASAITVVGLQGRSVATTIPTNGDVLSWNSITSKWTPTASISTSFDGNRAVKRSSWPQNVNVGTNTDIAAFLNAIFFPFISATISINSSVIYEIGTSNSVSVSGSTTVGDETMFSNGRVDQIYPSVSTVYTFGSATSYSTSINFIPDKSNSATLELRFAAYQGVDNNGSPTTINSSTKYVQSCYPFLHGVSSDNLTAGGTNAYIGLSGKLIAAKSNKTVSLTGTGYIYFCYPASYGSLTSILDHNGFEQIGVFTQNSANVTSVGLTNNWTESYYIYQSGSTVAAGWNYIFKY